MTHLGTVWHSVFMTTKMWAALMFAGWVSLLISWFLIDDRFISVVLDVGAVVMFLVALAGLARNRQARRT